MENKTIKVFVSQPMYERTKEEILKERNSIIEQIKTVYENIEVIDTWIEEDLTPIECIGKSIMMLKDADLAVFTDRWKTSRGCRIEYEVCNEYGIDTLTNLNHIKYLPKLFENK